MRALNDVGNVTAFVYIQTTLRGDDDSNDNARGVSPVLQSPAEYGRRCHCV